MKEKLLHKFDSECLTRTTWNCSTSSMNLVSLIDGKTAVKTNMEWKPSPPSSLLLLDALRYLGRGRTFDDIEEARSINAEMVRQFFHKFIKYGSTALYDKYVVTPMTLEDAEARSCVCKAGFPGCVLSTDATHVALDNCLHWLKHIHKDFKLALLSRTYNISVNHRKCILHSSSGHPTSWNDKTLQRFDNFMAGVKSGETLSDVVFT